MLKTVICKDVDSKEYDVPVDQLQWRPAAYGIVIKDGKILLSKQFGDRYDLPGGGIDLGETPEAGVIREIKEETGIDAKKPKFISYINSYFYSGHAEKEAYQCLMFFYLCEFAGGELSTAGFDEWEKQYAELAEWIPLETLDDIGIASSVDYRPFVKKALEER
jgi:8-oxo-dGTP diphosphatase